jgi:parvulin-like peptidyl-prolyl isomerase
MDTGFHVVRVVERTHEGLRPFDAKVQTEIRKKLQEIVQEREVRRIVETLWRRHQPQVLIPEPGN